MQRFSLFLVFIVLSGSAAADDPVCSRSDVVFCSEFEEGDKAIWDDYDGNPDTENQILQAPGPFCLAGNHVMRLRVPPGSGASDLVKELPGSYNRLYARWYQQWEPGYDFSARNHGSGLHAGNRNLLGVSGQRPDGDDRFSSGIEPLAGNDSLTGRLNLYSYYRGMYQDCVDPNGQCWGDHFPCMIDEGYYCEKPEHRETIMPPRMETGRWYCLEIMIDAGTPVLNDSEADGYQNFFIDGVAYGPWEHLWHRTTDNLQLTILWLLLYHHADHSEEGILLDNVVVAQERIGCLWGILFRGSVQDLFPGWKTPALPLTANTDDDTPPFPVAVALPGIVSDTVPTGDALVLYRLGLPCDVWGGNRLRAVKLPGGEVELHLN
ncbi:hypothetical protein ACFLU6_12180 [Acidobacteriota bacterium]